MGYTLNRRGFFALASGLLVAPGVELAPAPRTYSFVGGWAVHWLDDVRAGDIIRSAPYGVRCSDLLLQISAPHSLELRSLRSDGSIDSIATETLRRRVYGVRNDEHSADLLARAIRHIG